MESAENYSTNGRLTRLRHGIAPSRRKGYSDRPTRHPTFEEKTMATLLVTKVAVWIGGNFPPNLEGVGLNLGNLRNL